MKQIVIIVFVIHVVAAPISCKKEDAIVPVYYTNKLCYDGNCIKLNEAIIDNKTMARALSPDGLVSSMDIIFQTSADNYSDRLNVRFFSTDPNNLKPGSYYWSDHLFEPQSLTYAMMSDVGYAVNGSLFNGQSNLSTKMIVADQGSIALTVSNGLTTFNFSLFSKGKSFSGSYTGTLTIK